MTDHDQNEAALTLAGMISTTRPFAELHPSAAVPIAAQIVDAIRARKVPGICWRHDLDAALARVKEVEGEFRTETRILRAQIDGKDAEIHQLKERRIALANEANDCRSQANDLLRRFGDLERERDALKADNERLRVELQETKNELRIYRELGR